MWTNKFRSILLLVIGAVCALALIISTTLFKPTKRPTFQHPSGTVTTLEWFDFHTNSQILTFHPNIVSRIAANLPQEIRDYAMFRPLRFKIEPDSPNEPILSLVCSFDRLRDSSSVALRLAVSDENGNTYDPVGNSVDSDWVEFNTTMFPRRGRTVNLLIKNNLNDTIARFTIPNPARSEYVQWPKRPLPVIGTDQALEVELCGFRAIHANSVNEEEVSDLGMTPYGLPNNLPRTELDFRILNSDTNASNWKPILAELWDATGNHKLMHLKQNKSAPDAGKLSAAFFGALWPGEDAWKLRVEFISESKSEDSKSVKFEKIPLPGPEKVISLNLRQKISGIDMNIVGIMGVNAKVAEQIGVYNHTQIKGCVTVLMKSDAMSQGHRLTFDSADDSNGVPLIIEEKVFGPEEDKYDEFIPYSINLRPTSGSEYVDLSVILTPRKWSEFLAAPDHIGMGED